jgi:membrane protein
MSEQTLQARGGASIATSQARLTVHSFWTLLRQAFTAWNADYAPSMGAALSYYTVFSLAPLLIIAIALAGLFFGEEAARGQIVGTLSGLIGQDGAAAVEDMLAKARTPSTDIVASVISVSTLLIGATSVFGELQSALDRIWRAPAQTQRSGIIELLRGRLLSFGLVMSIGFLLLVSLLVSASIAAFGEWYAGLFPGWELLLQLLNTAIAFAITGVMFAAIYRVLPSVRIPWRDVWTGAWVTALLFTIGKFLIGFYIGKAAIASPFGAAGSIVVLLIWVYYSAQIFLLGAEFTWAYAQANASHSLHRPPDVAAGKSADARPGDAGARRGKRASFGRRATDLPAPTGA